MISTVGFMLVVWYNSRLSFVKVFKDIGTRLTMPIGGTEPMYTTEGTKRVLYAAYSMNKRVMICKKQW